MWAGAGRDVRGPYAAPRGRIDQGIAASANTAQARDRRSRKSGEAGTKGARRPSAIQPWLASQAFSGAGLGSANSSRVIGSSGRAVRRQFGCRGGTALVAGDDLGLVRIDAGRRTLPSTGLPDVTMWMSAMSTPSVFEASLFQARSRAATSASVCFGPLTRASAARAAAVQAGCARRRGGWMLPAPSDANHHLAASRKVLRK